MHRIVYLFAIIAASLLLWVGDAEAQHTGGSFGASSWGNRGTSTSTTRSQGSLRPSPGWGSGAVNRVSRSTPPIRVGSSPTRGNTVIVVGVHSHDTFHHHEDDDTFHHPWGDDHQVVYDSDDYDPTGVYPGGWGGLIGSILAGVSAFLFWVVIRRNSRRRW